jgi:hypothetical protein
MQGDLSSKAVTIGQSSDSRASGVYNGSSSKNARFQKRVQMAKRQARGGTLNVQKSLAEHTVATWRVTSSGKVTAVTVVAD